MNKFMDWLVKYIIKILIVLFLCILISFEYFCVSAYIKGPNEEQLANAKKQIQMVYTGDYSNITEKFDAHFSQDTISLDIQFFELAPTKKYTYNTLTNSFYLEKDNILLISIYAIIVYPTFSAMILFILIFILSGIEFLTFCIKDRNK